MKVVDVMNSNNFHQLTTPEIAAVIELAVWPID